MADLGKLQVSTDPVAMPIIDPITNEPFTTDDGDEMALLVVGVDSDVYQKTTNEILNRRYKKMANTRKVNITAEEADAEALQRTAAAVVGFKNIILNGETLEYSPKVAKQLLKDFPALREQVEDFVSDRANFLTNK